MSKERAPKSIPALKVRQWLTDWDEVQWSKSERRAEPQHWFYQFSIPAADLRALSGIYPRTTQRNRATDDLGIQRRHEKFRSDEISKFVRFGYPWSELSEARRKSEEFNDLRKPGWLPTAIVVNILKAGDKRLAKSADKADSITVTDGADGLAMLQLPTTYSGPDWRSKLLPPIEVIDGQHRLWAFDALQLNGNFELPVIAFVGLDLSWQAYLFYTINIKPKKINPSLAFDLYPLLRTEDWLNRFEGHAIYRETRSQELVDLLWSHPGSPWHKRINMLGETGLKGVMVTQAAWVRSLMAAFVKSWEGKHVTIGGLFGTSVGKHDTVLPWSRAQQAAFLIEAGQRLQDSVKGSSENWVKALRKQKQPDLFDTKDDLAFLGPHTLLNQDQGIRIFLQVVNDLCFVHADQLQLQEWTEDKSTDSTEASEIDDAIKSLKKQKKIVPFLKSVADALASYDWRASSGPDLTEAEATRKAAFRGSGGYKELRRDVLRHIAKETGPVATAAKEVIRRLGY